MFLRRLTLLRILCEKVRLLYKKLIKTAFFASFFPKNENQTTMFLELRYMQSLSETFQT